LPRIAASFVHMPTELFTVTVPASRSRTPKFVSGNSTVPRAGVTYASMAT